MYINCKGKLLSIESPLVMGIINTTPDSFYSGSRLTSVDEALKKAEQMIKEGATFLDIGGQSTRHGADLISETEELRRVIPIVEAISKEFPDANISIDTFSSKVAYAAVQSGACMINDISAGDDDSNMFSVVSQLKVPYIIMHKKGNPQNMQQHAQYQHVAVEVFDYLSQKISVLNELGVNDIIVDPGFGFGKTAEHNKIVLNQLSVFSQLNKPVLVGLSRKTMVWKALQTNPEEALYGTLALHTMALLNGANILRVHDVKPTMDIIKMVDLYAN